MKTIINFLVNFITDKRSRFLQKADRMRIGAVKRRFQIANEFLSMECGITNLSFIQKRSEIFIRLKINRTQYRNELIPGDFDFEGWNRLIPDGRKAKTVRGIIPYLKDGKRPGWLGDKIHRENHLPVKACCGAVVKKI